MDSDKTVLPQDALLENAEKYLKFFSTNDAGEPTLAASIIRSFVEREHKEQPKDTSSDLRERILDEIEDPADCEHGHPSCAKCLYERREVLLREAADSLNRTLQAYGRVSRKQVADLVHYLNVVEHKPETVEEWARTLQGHGIPVDDA